MVTPGSSVEQGGSFTEQDLLHLAMDHLHACSHLFRIGPGGLPSAGYLARVSLGLLLKALLLHRDRALPPHDELETLVAECRRTGANLPLTDHHRQLLARLDQIYTRPYPRPAVAARVRANDMETLHTLWHVIVDQFPAELIGHLSREDELELD